MTARASLALRTSFLLFFLGASFLIVGCGGRPKAPLGPPPEYEEPDAGVWTAPGTEAPLDAPAGPPGAAAAVDGGFR